MTPTLTDLAREFCRQNGIAFHDVPPTPDNEGFAHYVCSCGVEFFAPRDSIRHQNKQNPDLLDARTVLDVCKGWKGWSAFHRTFGSRERTIIEPDGNETVIGAEIPIDFMQDRTEGKMLRCAVEWRREHP